MYSRTRSDDRDRIQDQDTGTGYRTRIQEQMTGPDQTIRPDNRIQARP